MPFKFNPFTLNLDYFQAAAGGGGVADGKKLRVEYFEEIGAGTSGTVTLPTGATILLNQFGGPTDAVLTKVSASKPIPENVVDGSGNILSTTFDASGNWSLSGTPSAYPIAICYVFEVPIADYDDNDPNIISSYKYSGISATAIANGTVTDAEFQYLGTVTSNIQTQLDGKQASLGYTAENAANKDTDSTMAANSDTKYCSQKAVKTALATKENSIGYTTENVANKDTDGTLSANSDTKYCSQKAIKTYVDALVAYLVQGRNTSSPNATVPYHSLSATGSESNIDVAIQPKGTGAFSLNVSDGTTTGGNKRGTNAVDLQRDRGAATQVASGAGACVIGSRNTASGSNSFSIGYGNNVTGNTAMAYGNSNTSNASNSMALGQSNVASGNNSFAMGNTCLANSTYSYATGYQSATLGIVGRRAHGTGIFSVSGDSQHSMIHLRKQTTDGSSVPMTADGGVGSSTTRMYLQNNNAVTFKGMITAKKESNTSDVCGWKIEGLIVRGANAASTTLVGSSVSRIASVALPASWSDPVLTADTTNGTLLITIAGVAATNITWSADLEWCEVIC